MVFAGTLAFAQTNEGKTLYVIDGVVSTKEAADELPAETIKNMNIVKGVESVVVITTHAGREISGRVVDAEGKPMMGVIVEVPMSKSGVVTDFDGCYKIILPAGPFPYATEEVSFTNGGFIFNGTLTLPEGYSRETPVLLMVTGSGQQNRDEELFDHKPFAVIADALARSGVATLRYDDRGFGDPSANPMEWTTEDFKSDALAGLELLRQRFDKVGVLGHSEGGTIAMMIAAENKADFIVSLAGMAISGAETLIWQNKVALKGLGFTDEEIDSYCKMIGTAFDVRVNGGRMPNPDDYDVPESLLQNYWAVVAQIQMPYMIHFLSLDVRPDLGNITCPVLALNGSKDNQVDHESNLSAIRNGLPANLGNRIETVERLNHLFQHCSTGAVTEYRIIEETFAPEVLEKIVNWMSDFK